MSSLQYPPNTLEDPAQYGPLRRAEALRTQLIVERARSAELERRVAAREAQLEHVYRSRSWRLTVPLRTLGAALKGRGRARSAGRVGDVDAGPTIFIECTHTFHSDLNTGIQRVVRNVLRHASAVASELGYSVVPVILQNDRLVPADLDVVLSDKQAQAKPRRPPSRYDRQRHGARETATARRHLYLTLRPAWRAFLRLASALAPSNRAREFIYAPPYRPGLTQSILRVAQTFSGGTEAERLPTPHVGVRRSNAGDILLLLELVVDRAALAGGAAFQGARRSDRRGHLRHNPHIAPVHLDPGTVGCVRAMAAMSSAVPVTCSWPYRSRLQISCATILAHRRFGEASADCRVSSISIWARSSTSSREPRTCGSISSISSGSRSTSS